MYEHFSRELCTTCWLQWSSYNDRPIVPTRDVMWQHVSSRGVTRCVIQGRRRSDSYSCREYSFYVSGLKEVVLRGGVLKLVCNVLVVI